MSINTKSVTRLGAVATCAALAVTTAACGSSSKSGTSGGSAKGTKITFVGDWSSPNVLAIPIVAAIENGDYAKAGINLKLVLPPNNSTDEQMVGIGQAQFGASTNTDVMDAKQAGLPLITVANESAVNNWGIYFKPGTPVNKSTLTSGGIGGYGDTFTKAMLPFFFKKYGVNGSSAKQVTVTNDDIPLMIDGKIKFATSTSNFGAVEYKQTTGHAAGQVMATDVGAPNSPIWVYIGNSKWLAAHKSEAKQFLSATLTATQWAVANPTAAVKDYMKYFKSTGYDLAHNLAEWKATAAILKGPNGYFTGSAAQWSAMANALHGVGSLDKVMPASDYFTNAYLPSSGS